MSLSDRDLSSLPGTTYKLSLKTYAAAGMLVTLAFMALAKNLSSYTLYLCMLLYAGLAVAQDTDKKIEREARVERTDFPPASLRTIDLLNANDRKVKYYCERDGELVSYEAKFKYDGRRHSAEFDALGRLQDVEVKISKRRIDPRARELINRTLDTVARKYRIEKVQIQYLSDQLTPQQLKAKIDSRQFENYELVVAFKDQRKIYRREYLFTINGLFLRVRDIKRLEYDFLLF